MFGLGPLEIVIIGAIVLLIFGPAIIVPTVKAIQTAQKAKSQLTGAGALKHLLGEDVKIPTSLKDVSDSILRDPSDEND